METNHSYRSGRTPRRGKLWLIAAIFLALVLFGAFMGRGTIKRIRSLARIHRARLFTPVVSPAQSAPGIRSEVQFLQDLGAFYERIQKRSKEFSGELGPLVKEISDRQAEGKNVSYSMQIYREIRWLANFTSDEAATRQRTAELKQSLATDADQRFAEEQQPDGSWGAGYNVWFMKLFGTANEGLATGKPPRYPLSFLDRINSPEQLTNYLWSAVRDDFLGTRVINRMEADESASILGRLILGDTPCNYPFHPQLKEAYLKFVDHWQNPETGCWGTWFVDRDGTVWRMDDVGTTFHMVRRTKDGTKHLDRIARRVLQLSAFDFPMGIRVNGHYENHLNWDAIIIFQYAWPQLDKPTKAAARAEISKMLDWCLAESYQPDGSFKTSALDDTFGDAMEYGVCFLRDAGFFEKKKRFWTDRDFPQAAAVRDKIKARIQATGVNSPELKSSLNSLGAP